MNTHTLTHTRTQVHKRTSKIDFDLLLTVGGVDSHFYKYYAYGYFCLLNMHLRDAVVISPYANHTHTYTNRFHRYLCLCKIEMKNPPS